MLVDPKKRDKVDYITFEDVYVDENNVAWFPGFELNGLFSYDVCIKQLNYVVGFDEYGINATRLFSGIAGLGNKIILSPMIADYIAIYDKQTDELSKIMIKDTGATYKKNAKFWGVVCYKDVFYIIGHSYPAIIKVNSKTEEEEYYMIEDKEAYGKDIFRKSFCIKGNLLFLPCCYKNEIYIFDMEKSEGRFIEIGSKGNCYSGICFDGVNYWIAPIEGYKLVQWNYEDNTWKEFEIRTKISGSNQRTYLGCLFCKNKVFLIPAFGTVIAIIDVVTHESSFCDIREQSQIEQDDLCMAIPFRSYFIYGDTIWLTYKKNGMYYKYDFDKRIFCTCQEGIFFQKEDLFEMIQKKYNREIRWIAKSVEENNIYLPLFCKILATKVKEQENMMDEKIGVDIWNWMKNYGK